MPTPRTRGCEPYSQGYSACSAPVSAGSSVGGCPCCPPSRPGEWQESSVVALGWLWACCVRLQVRGTTGQPVRPAGPLCYPRGRMGSSRVRLGLRKRSGVSSLRRHWRKKKGRMRTELLAPVPGVGSRGGQVGCLGCVWEPGCAREGSRLANALVTMYCGAAVLPALWHLCSGKRINLYLY